MLTAFQNIPISLSHSKHSCISKKNALKQRLHFKTSPIIRLPATSKFRPPCESKMSTFLQAARYLKIPTSKSMIKKKAARYLKIPTSVRVKNIDLSSGRPLPQNPYLPSSQMIKKRLPVTSKYHPFSRLPATSKSLFPSQ